MTEPVTDFWQHYPTGIDVAVASRLPDKLYGVRDAFNRYFGGGSRRVVGGVDVAIRAVDTDGGEPVGLEDGAILEQARIQARAVAEGAGKHATFAVGTEAGFAVQACGDERRFLLRTWSVVIGLEDESWGASGGVQVPQRLLSGVTDDSDVPMVVPTGSTRRHGGMVASLTAGLEDRRSATALATFNALASLFYGIFDRPPAR